MITNKDPHMIKDLMYIFTPTIIMHVPIENWTPTQNQANLLDSK
jgi:hypothetical protein